MQCDGAVELERLLTVVVFDHFQLVEPAKPMYVPHVRLGWIAI